MNGSEYERKFRKEALARAYIPFRAAGSHSQHTIPTGIGECTPETVESGDVGLIPTHLSYMMHPAIFEVKKVRGDTYYTTSDKEQYDNIVATKKAGVRAYHSVYFADGKQGVKWNLFRVMKHDDYPILRKGEGMQLDTVLGPALMDPEEL